MPERIHRQKRRRAGRVSEVIGKRPARHSRTSRRFDRDDTNICTVDLISDKRERQTCEVAAASGGTALAQISERLTKVSVQDIILFTKQFRTMIRAGVSMLNLLQILEDQTENPKLKKVLGSMHQDINEGASLTEAFEKNMKKKTRRDFDRHKNNKKL